MADIGDNSRHQRQYPTKKRRKATASGIADIIDSSRHAAQRAADQK
jgi:hypothetical protein